MERLYVDTETYSEVDIKTAGGIKYTADCEMILARFKLGEKAYTWDCYDDPYIPDWVLEHVSCGKQVVAHNALFDFLVLEPFFDGELTLKQMRCTQAKAQAHGLPGKLDKATEALGAPVDKKKSAKGNRLIKLFSMPRKPTKMKLYTRATAKTDPKDWALFRDEYLYQDVEAVEWLDNTLPDLSKSEQETWLHTQRLNLRGIPIDLPMVKHIADAIDQSVDEHASKFIRQTGIFPTQVARIQQWVNNHGVLANNLTVGTVDKIIAADDTPDKVKDALITRQNISHAAFKKYPAMIAACSGDGTVKGCFQYHAAHTGRYGGRLIQPHNFPRGNTDAVKAVELIKDGQYEVDLVKSAVRGMVYHPNGFTIADYGAIEARVLHWLVGDVEGLDIFRSGDDPYKHMASKIYETPYEEITGQQRFVGKQAVLGLGYQMGHQRFIDQAAGYGVIVGERTAIRAVMVYRRVNSKIVDFWRMVEQGAKMALERPTRTIKVNKYVSFLRPANSLFLYMILPSGRRVAYPYPEVDGKAFSHMSLELYQWKRTNTYGGKLTENAVQAIARDVLVDALKRMQSLDVVMHVHDEVVTVGDNVKALTEIMEVPPPWAEDLPLVIDVHKVKRFKKL